MYNNDFSGAYYCCTVDNIYEIYGLKHFFTLSADSFKTANDRGLYFLSIKREQEI